MNNQFLSDPFSAGAIRNQVKERLVFSADDHDGDFRMNPEFKDWVVSKAVKPAAVMIGLVERSNGMNVLLTKRTEHLSSHSGQVAFPGGKIDDTDDNPIAAALREAHEEIAVSPDKFEVLCQMPCYYSGSGYAIHPVLAFMDPHAQPDPNPDEVDYIFETPLSFLMDDKNHIRASKVWNGKERFYLEMPYDGHYIWGVTAGIIHALYERVFK